MILIREDYISTAMWSGQRIRIYNDLFIYCLEVFNKISIHNPHLIYILSTSLQLLPTYYLKHIYKLSTSHIQHVYNNASARLIHNTSTSYLRGYSVVMSRVKTESHERITRMYLNMHVYVPLIRFQNKRRNADAVKWHGLPFQNRVAAKEMQ